MDINFTSKFSEFKARFALAKTIFAGFVFPYIPHRENMGTIFFNYELPKLPLKSFHGKPSAKIDYTFQGYRDFPGLNEPTY